MEIVRIITSLGLIACIVGVFVHYRRKNNRMYRFLSSLRMDILVASDPKEDLKGVPNQITQFIREELL